MSFKRVCALLLCGTLLTGLSASSFAVDFPDVSQEHWAYHDIQTASDYGLVQGLEDGTFRPEETLTRAAFVTILQRMFSWASVTPDAPSFSDVQPGDWYFTAAETALANGVLEPGLFQPSAYITREDMAVMLVRALGYDALAQDIAGQGCPFPDVTRNQGYLSLAASIGMTNGMTDPATGQTLFQPTAFATRGQAAAMLARVYARYTTKIDWLNGFYAFSSYGQINLTDQMDVVCPGWARLSIDPVTGPWINSTSADGNDWVKPNDSSLATSHFEANGTPYCLNVYTDTTQNLTLADGTVTSTLEALLSSGETQATAVAAIVAASADYAGISIDFEGLRTTDYRDAFSAFMAQLRGALPAEKQLFVCVPPDEWYKGYDFRALGEICDKVIYMAHDYQWTSIPESYLGSVMGASPERSTPVTPFPKIYQALAAITHPDTGVQDKSKIALQISFGAAGVQVDEENRLVSTTLFRPSPATIAQRLGQADTLVTYDVHSRNPMARYTGDDGGTYLLWYEDARSVGDKLDLARMFGITGISLWRLGNIPQYSTLAHYDVWTAVQSRR